MENALLAEQFTVAGVIVWLMQKLKATKHVKFVTQETDGLNRVLAVLAAASTGAGLSFQFDPTAGSLLITGITAAAVINFVWTAVTQLVMQEVIYRGAVKK